MPHVLIHQQNIHYQQHGQGIDVVCLLGWGQTMVMFEPTLKHLSKHFRVTLFEFPGFGESEALHNVWDMQAYTDFFHELLQKLSIKTPILIAHSFGARVAAIYATQHPTLKLVLTGAAGLKAKPRLRHTLQRLPYRWARSLLRRLGLKTLEERLKRRSGSADYRALSGAMRDSFVKIVNQDLKSYYQQIQVPTLLIWGEKDEATPLWMGKALEIMMKDAGLVIFEGDDHYAYYHQIDRFHRIVDAFLKEESHA